MSNIEQNKAKVRLLIDRVINEWCIEEIGSVFKPGVADKARQDFVSFREAFPDWRMELNEMVAEDDTVVARFTCRGTQRGEWQGDPPTGKAMAVDEVFFFRFEDGLVADVWGLEDTWTRKGQLGLR
ncbi:MAG: ester cyclase [Actinomycetota bacterium]|nr:ester cyclase [Actinomycetota bacterium]